MRLQLRLRCALVLAFGCFIGCAAAPRLDARTITATAGAELAVYADTDHVTVVSPGVAGSIKNDSAGWSLSGSYLVDAVSAASVDIVSTASSRWKEARQAGSLGGSLKRGITSVSLSGNLSFEPDYLSIGVGAVLTFDTPGKNVTPFFGISYGHDDVGRTGLPQAYWHVLQRGNLMAGLTVVLHPRVIASLQLDAGLEGGYLAKPYRYIPLFAPGTGDSIPAGASPDVVNQARLDERPVDQLPSLRDRFAVTGRIAARLPPCTLRLDERVYTDSWSMWASTTDLHLPIDVGKRLVLMPHVRYHVQSAVSFWRRAYEVEIAHDGTIILPAFRSGDRELSALQTVTFAATARVRLSTDPRTPVYLAMLVSGGYTAYPDVLYITERWTLFSSLSLNAEWN